MKCARVLAAAVVMLAAWTSYGQPQRDAAGPEAAPFGLRQGMSVEELGANATHIGGGLYKLASVPLPHSDFEFYVAQVSPRTGLCFIKGVGKPVRTSAYGTELQTQFAHIRDELSAAYGRYRTVDMLLSDSMWQGPGDWMASLADRERLLFAHWTVETHATLRPHLTNVFAAANAKSSESGYVVVEYFFDNEPVCQEEVDGAANAALLSNGNGARGGETPGRP